MYVTNWKLNLNNCHSNEKYYKNQSRSGKLATYKTLKKSFTLENYLSVISDKEKRTTFAKIRTSNHILEIEKGRHLLKPLPAEQRICKMCNLNLVEDETHFIMVCPKFTTERQMFLDNVQQFIPSFKTFSIKQQFIYLFTSKEADIIMPFSNYISNIYAIRKQAGCNIP